MDQRDYFRTVTALTKAGQVDEALRTLRDALSRKQLDAEGIEKAGRLCNRFFADASRKTIRVLVLGQCTTTWLTNVLAGVAWGSAISLHVVDGEYDNVMQELLSLQSTSERPDVVVLLPWNQRLLFAGRTRAPQERIDEECDFWRQAWAITTDRLGARIVQVGYDWVTPGALGYALGGRADGDAALVRAMNDAVRQRLPPGAIFTELEQISGVMGRERFYDPRRYHWTKQPFSEEGTVRLAQHLSAEIRALMTGPKKVLVLDLDNTLWGGVVGETGPLGIELGEGPDGEAFRAFQAYVKQLTQRGIVLAVASKNNDADAREPFEKNPGMILSIDDFAQFEASWDPKAVSLKRIAKSLELGLDSFVFFDDNPAEREHIRQSLPEVSVVDVPEDPSEYVRALDAALWFEAADLTAEDRVRVDQYRAERRRRASEVEFESIDAYLDSLGMVADVRRIDDADLDRVVQLIGKTNQFNLTTRRHSLAKVREMLAAPGTIGLTLRLVDRFGDYGLVSVLIAVVDPQADPRALQIDTWLMSCRVISRTVEEYLFNTLQEAALREGIESLVGVYVPTAKNGLVKDLYDRCGFGVRTTAGDTRIYDLHLAHARTLKTFVHAKPQTAEMELA